MCKKCVQRMIKKVGNYMGFSEMGIEIIENNDNTYIYHDKYNGVVYYKLTTKEILEMLLIHFDKNEIEIMCNELKGVELYDSLNEWFQYKHELEKLIKIYNR